MKYSWLYVFLGGGLGSVCRYYLSSWCDKKFAGDFPIGTFTSNMLASLIFGFVAGFMLKNVIQEQFSLFLLAGFCGGFSTFSTFSKDNFFLLQQGAYMQLFLNVFLSLLIGIGFFFLGMIIGKNI